MSEPPVPEPAPKPAPPSEPEPAPIARRDPPRPPPPPTREEILRDHFAQDAGSEPSGVVPPPHHVDAPNPRSHRFRRWKREGGGEGDRKRVNGWVITAIIAFVLLMQTCAT